MGCSTEREGGGWRWVGLQRGRVELEMGWTIEREDGGRWREEVVRREGERDGGKFLSRGRDK